MAKDANFLETVVGIDVGRSGVKLSFMFSGNPKEMFIPSVVLVAKKLTFSSNQEQIEKDTVVVDGKEHFVGVSAIEQGATETVGLSDNWLKGIEHRALLIRSQRLLKSYGILPTLVVVGLPVATFASHREILSAQVSEVFECKVLPVPQPWGVYQDQILNNNGLGKKSAVSALKEKIAIIDVGHYTTDIMLMSNQNWIQDASGSSVGIYKAINALKDTLTGQGINTTTLECQEILVSKEIKEFGKMRDISDVVGECLPATVDEVVRKARNLLDSHARSIDHIYIAGGGAEPVYEALSQIWPQAKLAENPRYSVVSGMRKYGVFLASQDKKQ